MLSKRPHPMIGKLSELLVSGNRAAVFSDIATSPRGPLDFKIQSPRGSKKYDLGGVGLGIVAALEKSSDYGRREILAKYTICGSNSNRSDPIPCGKNCEKLRKGFEELEMESNLEEDYTYVTCREPNKKSYTKVYYDGAQHRDRIGVDRRFNDVGAVVKESPARFVEDFSRYPTSDFLSSCHLCRKNLHGKDIYMYRGEKGFCSTECRSRQIMMDERKEQCRTEVSRSAKASSSPYSTGQIFSMGILAI